MTDFVVVIPARYASQRLPGKPLRDLCGKPMLQHVYERATASLAQEVIVATDDERIMQAAQAFGATACLTSRDHQSGTERLAEVSLARGWPDERVIVNLQGDEPLMPPALINQCAELLLSGDADIATLASPLESQSQFDNPNVVKVLVDAHGNAIYFSRAAVPYARNREMQSLASRSALKHHGIYAYRTGVLRKFVKAEASPLEVCEQLEQLRALTIGLTIRVGVPSAPPGPGVDTEDDLAEVARILTARGD